MGVKAKKNWERETFTTFTHTHTYQIFIVMKSIEKLQE